jgi:hypothetical protein
MHLNLSLDELKKMYDDAFEQGVFEGSIRATGECREEYFRRTFPTNEHSAAVETLKSLRYTYHGGERWKPPLGSPPQDEERDDPCPGCQVGAVCRTPACGRLKLPPDHPYRSTSPVQDDYKAWYEEAMIASNEAGFAGLSAAETIRELDRMVSAQPGPTVQPVAWRFTGIAGFKRFVTEAQYKAFSPEVRAWYEPFKCATCTTPPDVAAPDRTCECNQGQVCGVCDPITRTAYEPVGEAEPFSGASVDHTEAVFLRSKVPVGTKLYTKKD